MVGRVTARANRGRPLMETGIVDVDAYDVLKLDALAELRNHADAESAAARDDEDERRAGEIRRMAEDLEHRLEQPPL